MSDRQESTLSSPQPISFFLVICTTVSILIGPARKILLQFLARMQMMGVFVFIINFIGTELSPLSIWLLFAKLLVWLGLLPFALCNYEDIFAEFMYKIAKKVYTGENPHCFEKKWIYVRNSKMMKASFAFEMHCLFLYTFFALAWTNNENQNPFHSKQQDDVVYAFATAFAVVLILALPSFFINYGSDLQEPPFYPKTSRWYIFCKDNFFFVYITFLGYTFGVIQLEKVFGRVIIYPLKNVALNQIFAAFAYLCWFNTILTVTLFTSGLVVVRFMSIQVQFITKEVFSKDSVVPWLQEIYM